MMSGIANKERFNTLAQEWDSKPERVQGAMTFVDKIIDTLDKDIKNFSVLDYGSGSGLVSFGFANKVSSILGLDNSEAMIEKYNEKIKSIGFDNISSNLHDINKEDISKDQYNLIVTNMTMHHITDTRMFIEKLASGLKEGGTLFIADLVTEDGTFHSDNTGVEHFGFDMGHIESLFIDAGLKGVSIEVLNTIEKPQNKYEVFIVKGTK